MIFDCFEGDMEDDDDEDALFGGDCDSDDC